MGRHIKQFGLGYRMEKLMPGGFVVDGKSIFLAAEVTAAGVLRWRS